jgi:hypothetical protein
MPEIKVIIQRDGQIQVDAVGFTGTSCTEATAALISALGTPTKDEKKPEYYELVSESTRA